MTKLNIIFGLGSAFGRFVGGSFFNFKDANEIGSNLKFYINRELLFINMKSSNTKFPMAQNLFFVSCFLKIKNTTIMATKNKKGEHKIEKVMHEFKEGELKSGRSGKVVKGRKQAVAIALSEARKAGAKIPKKKS